MRPRQDSNLRPSVRSPLGHFGVRQTTSESEEVRTLRAAQTNPVLMPAGQLTTGLYKRDCETSNRSYRSVCRRAIDHSRNRTAYTRTGSPTAFIPARRDRRTPRRLRSAPCHAPHPTSGSRRGRRGRRCGRRYSPRRQRRCSPRRSRRAVGARHRGSARSSGWYSDDCEGHAWGS